MRNEKLGLIINDIRSSLPLYLLIFCQILLVFYVVGSSYLYQEQWETLIIE